ncbi:uncharacterized protein LOC116134519 [Pistacia vera]|uniref:uncharacterized protein LOC116134519 n=1 Tax=Pistacia vera TaxID=55513 RepID=UPI001263BF94|nr:uncharacterized protein LOC116134519 [Pistacia vera]
MKGKGADNVQPSNNSINKKGDEATQTKQVDLTEKTENLEGQIDLTEKTENLQSEKSDQSVLKGKVDNARFKPLIKAVQKRNWTLLQDLVNRTPWALTETVSEFEDTIFHIINVSAAPTWLIKKLAFKISAEELQNLRGEFGRSVLFHSAIYGNRNAAKAYVLRNTEFPNIRNEEGYLPIHEAARYGHKGIIQYLLSKTKVRLDDDKGVQLIKDLISSGHYGIALDLWKGYPKLALENNADRKSILKILAGKPLAFKSASWSRLGFWRRLIYDWIPLQEEYVPHNESNNGDIENAVKCPNELGQSKHFGPIRRIIYASFGALRQMIWHILMLLVPEIKNIRDTKLTHIQTLKIVRILCHGSEVTWNRKEAFETFLSPFLEAAKLGICEIVDEIFDAYFYAYTYRYKDNGHGLLHMVILHRQEKIFKIIQERNVYLSSWKAVNKGGKTDNMLHLAGRLAASSQVSGAALQMQRELQWFKAVESYVHPSLQEQQNKNNKTPREVFTEEHKELVKQGEEWMKGTATSCSVVAALIITVVFTAAFTVPGGNNNDGIPIFLRNTTFIVFVISDALALFSSTASVLMFLAILSSRYSEDDFLLSLPRKLIIGLITLFFSIASMMVAFGATLYTFLSHSWNWTVIPISLLGCLPVALFVMLQCPLLVEIFSSTYRPIISITPNK